MTYIYQCQEQSSWEDLMEGHLVSYLGVLLEKKVKKFLPYQE